MTQLSEKNDFPDFPRDPEYMPKKEKHNPKKKNIFSTKRDLEEYFSFLEDVLPVSSQCTKRQMPVDKVFEF